MAFDFDELMRCVRRDNPTYERILTSRLHNLVTMLAQRPLPSPAHIRNTMEGLAGDAWTKYRNTKAYLIRQFALAGLEVPAGQAVQGIAVHHQGTLIQGYPAGPVRAGTTGRSGRPDGRFYWSIEVVYTLADGVDPQSYAPFRNVKDEQAYRYKPFRAPWQPTPPMAVVTANARGKPWQADGPRHYNVKRAVHTLSVHDGPGIDTPGAAFLTSDRNSYPIRQAAFFTMSLYRLQPEADLQRDFDVADFRGFLGEVLPGSQVGFHYEMWRDAPDADPGGNFYLD